MQPQNASNSSSQATQPYTLPLLAIPVVSAAGWYYYSSQQQDKEKAATVEDVVIRDDFIPPSETAQEDNLEKDNGKEKKFEEEGTFASEEPKTDTSAAEQAKEEETKPAIVEETTQQQQQQKQQQQDEDIFIDREQVMKLIDEALNGNTRQPSVDTLATTSNSNIPSPTSPTTLPSPYTTPTTPSSIPPTTPPTPPQPQAPSIITAADLIAASSSSKEAPDWDGFKYRHRQAVADSEYFNGYLTQQQSSMSETIAHLKHLIEKQEERHEQDMKRALRSQAQQMAEAQAVMAVKERKERNTRLDEIRLQVDALGVALKQKSKEATKSHNVHKLSSAVAVLRNALESGQPLKQPLVFLSQHCSDDPLVAVAVAALAAAPIEVSTTPLPTRVQIKEGFKDIKRVCGELSLIPEGKGGLLSLATAKVAAALKVNPLSEVERELTDGELVKATALLEAATRETAAAPEVAVWARRVRARALAEQTAQMLAAHAAAVSSPLSH
jgi:hypothetical protein